MHVICLAVRLSSWRNVWLREAWKPSETLSSKLCQKSKWVRLCNPSLLLLSPPTFFPSFFPSFLPFIPFFLPSLPPSPFLAPLTLQAAYARDALCKAIYTRLFTWLVNRINDRIKVSITLFDTNDRKSLIQTMKVFKYWNLKNAKQITNIDVWISEDLDH